MAATRNEDTDSGCGIAVIAVIIAFAAYATAVYYFFANVASYVFAVTLVGFTGLILVNYGRGLLEGLVWKTLEASRSNAATPPEPAYKNYFFRKAYFDYRDIVMRSYELSRDHLMEVKKRVGQPLMDMAFWTWPLILTLGAVFLVGSLAGLVAFGVFSFIHLAIVVAVCLVAYTLALYFRLAEFISMQWRRISYVCPHPNCYERIALPVYECATCGAKHKQLMPGSYGVFRRKCKCGSKLPTLAWLGRSKISAYCPNEACRKPLNAEIGRNPDLHFPIVAGPNAGKTSYLMATAIELENDCEHHDRRMSFPDENDAQTYAANKLEFQQGHRLDKTTAKSPKAFSIQVTNRQDESQLLYMYDAAGELYGNEDDRRRQQTYFSHANGVVFLIDPFSIGQVKTEFQTRIGSEGSTLQPSSEVPQDIYARMYRMLQQITDRAAASIPVAVVLTKIDAFELKDHIGPVTSSDDTAQDTQSSQSIRQWLSDKGEGNLVRALEKDFKKVRYFAVSAQGRMADEYLGTAFEPDEVLPPLEWLLAESGVRITGASTRRIGWRSEGIANSIGLIVATLAFVFLFSLLLVLSLRLTDQFGAPI